MGINNYSEFLDEFFRRLAKTGIDVTDLYMDHLAYKTGSEEEYFRILPEFEKMGIVIKENIVRERRVGHIKLFSPIVYRTYNVPAIEIIAPKHGEISNSGWEHAEFVLKEDYKKFMDKYPTLNWDTSVMNADEFSMIKLKLGEDMQVKFHLKPMLVMISNN